MTLLRSDHFAFFVNDRFEFIILCKVKEKHFGSDLLFYYLLSKEKNCDEE